MIAKNDIEIVKEWAEEHITYCSNIWSVDFEFDHYDAEVRCFYLRDHRLAGRETLQFRHLFDLEKKIQEKYSNKYRIGIIYETMPLS
jgi:hypothetical protein|tara:strand:- start:70 stop:330 length:261 start_codon:yes stop_codon:yes gene_type:complete